MLSHLVVYSNLLLLAKKRFVFVIRQISNEASKVKNFLRQA